MQSLLKLLILGGVSLMLVLCPLNAERRNSSGAPVAPDYYAPSGQRLEFPSSFSLALDNRERVRDFYRNVYFASEGFPMEWTGSYDSGNSGSTSEDFREATRLRVNFFRAMAGIPADVFFNEELHLKSQDAALMMSANSALSHDPDPPSDWTFYTEDGAEAAGKSNLAIGSIGPDSITGYIRDKGKGNERVGHRRWILYPNNNEMATGDVPGNDSLHSANCLWVISDSAGNRPQTRDDFVAWPPPGYVPHPLVYARWSFSLPGADFSSASVSMNRDGESIPVEIEPLSTQNIGEPTIVWIPDNLDPNSQPPEDWPRPQEDETISVSISDVDVNGANEDFNYEVTIFDPASPTPDSPDTTISGPDKPTVDAQNTYTVAGRDYGEGIQWRVLKADPVTWSDGAENGLNRFVVDVSGYTPIQSDRTASGSNAFHLVHNQPESQFLEFNGEYIISNDSSLSFQSSLAFAKETQFARVQISTNGGVSWETVWENTGPIENNNEFNPVSIDLSPFSGKSMNLRFHYFYVGNGQYYPGNDPHVGWAIDDVQLSNVEEVSESDLKSQEGDQQFNYKPTETGTVYLQAREFAFNGFHLDWGTLFSVSPESGITLTPGEWKLDPSMGWIYGSSGSWGFSTYSGWTYYGSFPWIYHPKEGWFAYMQGNANKGLWLYSRSRGWSFTVDTLGGWYQFEPFDDSSWGNFLENP